MSRVLSNNSRKIAQLFLKRNKRNKVNQHRFINPFSSFSTANLEDEKKHVNSPYPPVERVVGVSIVEMYRENFSKSSWGNAVAFEDGVTGDKMTHSQVFKNSSGLAAALLQMGMKSGEVVGVVLPNCIEYASILFGIWEAGLISSTVNPAYTMNEIKRQLESSDAKCVITSPIFLDAIKEAKITKGSQIESIIVVGEATEGCHTWSEMVKCDISSTKFFKGTQEDTIEKIAILPYSSGTTGPPKGVMLTHSNICTNLMQTINSPGLVQYNKFEAGNEQERFLGILPFFHSYGLAGLIMLTMWYGARTFTLPKFDPDTFKNTFKSAKLTTAHLVTPLLNLIVNSPDYTSEDFEKMHTILCAAAPIGPLLINRVLDKSGKYLFFQEGYGMTELSPVSHVLHPKTKNTKIGSCGSPIASTETKIVDITNGKVVGRNEKGEICIRGPQVMKGYYKNEKSTKDTIDADGFLHTGDVGYYDEDGALFIVDRIKELIKVKGFQVAPSELEDLLRQHPGVEDTAVIGIKHEEFGELPRAYIVKKTPDLDEETIHSYVKENLAAYKQLRGGISFVKQIPKAPSGKILRRVLSEEYKAKFG